MPDVVLTLFRRYIGSIIAGWVIVGCSYLETNNGWRIPIWCQMITSGFVAVSVWFLPESPRWLIANDRYDEATAVLAHYHGEGSASHPMVQLQLKEMQYQIGTHSSDKKWWDYRELWNSHSARRRTYLRHGHGYVPAAVRKLSHWLLSSRSGE
jgi:hypothetical protein